MNSYLFIILVYRVALVTVQKTHSILSLQCILLMKQEREINFKKDSKFVTSGPVTRRSMISRDQNTAPIYEPNIEDILALELSDTLINTAYYLSVTKMSVGIHKLCDSLQYMYVMKKCLAFQNLKIHSNRSFIDTELLQNNKRCIYNKTINQVEIQSTTNNIDLRMESQINDQNIESANMPLTAQQRHFKVRHNVKEKINQITKIIQRKVWKISFLSYERMKKYNKFHESDKRQANSELRGLFGQGINSKERKFNRRSIEKEKVKKSMNVSSFSLNKHNHGLHRVSSPNSKNKNNINLIVYANKDIGTDKKASTCSQTHSNNSRNDNSNKEYYTARRSNVLNNQDFANSKKGRLTEFKQSSLLMNQSYFGEGTKLRELEILRKKYYRLVEEFKEFSERFLQVIKEE